MLKHGAKGVDISPFPTTTDDLGACTGRGSCLIRELFTDRGRRRTRYSPWGNTLPEGVQTHVYLTPSSVGPLGHRGRGLELEVPQVREPTSRTSPSLVGLPESYGRGESRHFTRTVDKPDLSTRTEVRSEGPTDPEGLPSLTQTGERQES